MSPTFTKQKKYDFEKILNKTHHFYFFKDFLPFFTKLILKVHSQAQLPLKTTILQLQWKIYNNVFWQSIMAGSKNFNAGSSITAYYFPKK